MRRIRVKGYRRQDGTPVRAHEKNVTSSPILHSDGTLDLFSLEQIVEVEDKPVFDSSFPTDDQWEKVHNQTYQEENRI